MIFTKNINLTWLVWIFEPYQVIAMHLEADCRHFSTRLESQTKDEAIWTTFERASWKEDDFLIEDF
jgi:hypothetical protein